MTRRFEKALFIQKGAVNPSGIALTLHEACKECLDEGVSQREDPAVRLIVHQLAYLCNITEIETDVMAYSRLTQACEAKVKSEQGPVKIVDGLIGAPLAKALIRGTLEHVANMKADDHLPTPRGWDMVAEINKQFEGTHEHNGSSFEVCYLDEEVKTAGEPFKPGWYFQVLPAGDAQGPYPTAEGAYLAAIGD